MIVFASDLDNTLIYSERRLRETAEVGGLSGNVFPDDFVCVEYLDGKEQSYMSRRSVALLSGICAKAEFIPVTTRSLEQYRRIIFPAAVKPRRALAANGAVLFEDGELCAEFIGRSKIYVDSCRGELRRLAENAAADDAFDLPPRFVDDMFLFLRCAEGTDARAAAEKLQGETPLFVGVTGRKIYVFPKGIDKGTSLVRLKQKLVAAVDGKSPAQGKADGNRRLYVFAAGDSAMDIPMLTVSDAAFAPKETLAGKISGDKVVWCDGDKFFAEEILRRLSALLADKKILLRDYAG